MTIQLDPQGRETRALFTCVPDFTGMSILEVGCGDGRLTWRYAEQAARVVAIDPKPEKITRALRARPSRLERRVDFHALDLESYARRPTTRPLERFDLALLSWSL